MRPLEVVEQAPVEVAPHRQSFADDRVNGGEAATDELDPLVVVSGRGAVLGDDQVLAGMHLRRPSQGRGDRLRPELITHLCPPDTVVASRAGHRAELLASTRGSTVRRAAGMPAINAVAGSSSSGRSTGTRV